MNPNISALINEKSPLILAEIQKAHSILLHCHPSPDPDSAGSALATKFVLEQMGKNVTVIRGDSEIPEAFMHFPGAKDIVAKNFFEIDLKSFDLFIIQDSGSPEQISRLQPVVFPLSIPTIVIDHHVSNSGFATINLVESNYPATGQVLFDLFTSWNIKFDKNIASNLFIGIYTDTGGFKYSGTTTRTFDIAAELIKFIPDFSNLISEMENSTTPADVAFQALALSSIETFFDEKVALAIVSSHQIKEKNIPLEDVQAHSISPVLRRVKKWLITGAVIEPEPGKVKVSFRSKDGNIFDVSKLAAALGGGGHKAAAGSVLKMSINEARSLVVQKIKELYNL